LLVAAAVGFAAPDLSGRSEIDALLARIRKVGREGAGNAEAAKAWKALVARGEPALIPILSAMNDDDSTATNWLRPAFEAVAEQLRRSGKSLPKEKLASFLTQTSNPGCGRRLAYVDEGKALLMKKDDAAAKQAFQRALSGACDQDQVDAAVEALGKLGVKVDKQAHFGVVRSWRLVAPFDHTNTSGWDKEYPPEKGVDLTASYTGKNGKAVKWIATDTTDPYGVVDLNKVLGKIKGAVAYAYAVIDSPKARVVEFRAGSANALKIFLNGKPIFTREEYHHAMNFDQYSARGALRAGRNEILLKVCQNEQTESWAQAWKFQLRVCDFVGAAVPFTPVVLESDKKEKR
jgi:hypothetical protein